MGKLTMDTIATPNTPASGDSTLYFDETSKTLKSIDDAGDVTEYLSTITQGVFIAQEVHVSAGTGNDTTGDGTVSRPYKTLKYAVSTITDSSASKSYQVVIHSGTYNEVNPITLPTYVHIKGVTEASVNLVSTDNDSNFFITSGLNFIANVNIVGPTNAAAIKCSGCERLAVTESICTNSLTGVEINQIAGGQAFVQNCAFLNCTTGVKSLGKEFFILSLDQFSNCSTDISVADSDAILVCSTVNTNRNKITLPDQYTNFFGNFNDITTGDEALVLYSELAVGRPELGRESIFGEGDSYTRGLLFYSYNASTTVFTNRTANIITPGDGNTVGFDGTAVDNALYLTTTLKDKNGDKIPFLGAKDTITVAGIGGSYLFEYWNGGSWVPMNRMVVSATSNYLVKEDLFDTVGTYQVRYDDSAPTSWVANDPMGLGIDYYWVRVRITSPITLSPQFDQIKVHTNRTELNEDGYLEYFGKARPINTLPIIYGSLQSATASPSDQDIYISDNLDVGMIENNFTNAATDRTGLAFYIPLDLDSSCPVRFRLSYFGTAAGTDAVDWNIRWGYSSPGDTIYTSAATAPTTGINEQLISRSTAMPLTANTLQSEIFELDVSTLIIERDNAASGDILWVSIERTGTTDAYSGDVIMVSISPYYTKWRDGGYIGNWL
jgi:hypothetical protein